MPRRDEIDATLAKRFAWRFVPADQTAELTDALTAEEPEVQPPRPVVPAAPPEEVERADQERRAGYRAACQPLAPAVAQVWSCADEGERLRMARRLLGRAERLGVEVLGMDAWPLEGARLLRIFAQLWPKLTAKQRERAAAVAGYVPLDHPEAADLFVEIARGGDRAMADAIFAEEDWMPGVGDEDALVARLADVIDEGPTMAARSVAIDILSRFESREPALAALRRALRLPSIGVRARALDALVHAEPCALGAQDLVQVLRDLAAHPPPELPLDDEREQDEETFADAVLAAAEHLQTEDLAEALLDCIDAEVDSIWLSPRWATEALAVGFPETAAVMVDHWLRCARGFDRWRALGALERLPMELAEPRLRLAANDPSSHVRDEARRIWLRRTGQSFAPTVDGLVGALVLEGPPSERFWTRLAVIQGRVADARRAMERALLVAAPDPEALALLLQLAADDSESSEPVVLRAEGADDGLAARIAARFGAAGVRGLCAIARRFAEPERFGWMRRVGDLFERGVIGREHETELRDLAAAHVGAEDAAELDDSLRLLALVGPPPELLGRVLTIALGDAAGAWEARKLVAAWPDRSIDARLASEMALALADQDWGKLEHVSWMALKRDIAAAHVVAQRVLEVAEKNEDALEPAVACVRGMRETGALPDAWALAVLQRPESPLFVAAARAWWGAPVVRAALEAALASPARKGESAAVAALALLGSQPPLSPRDRRLPRVLAAAPIRDRADLVSSMCVHGVPFAVVAPFLEPLLTSDDPYVTDTMAGVAHWWRSPKARALLRSVLPRIVDGSLRAEIEEDLGQTPTSFWAEG